MQRDTDRAAMLRALRCVDEAIIATPSFLDPWRDCFPLVERLKPDVWVLGPDDLHAAEKRVFAKVLGIAVVQDTREKPYSTTALLERVASLPPHRRTFETFKAIKSELGM